MATAKLPFASGGRRADLLLRASTLVYVGIIVALPLAALTFEAVRPGAGPFWDIIRDPYAWHSLKLTFVTARPVLSPEETGSRLGRLLADQASGRSKAPVHEVIPVQLEVPPARGRKP